MARTRWVALAFGLAATVGACSSNPPPDVDQSSGPRAGLVINGAPVDDRVASSATAYLADATSINALALVDSIRRSAKIDDTPYLVDLVRMTGSSQVRSEAITALGEISGIEVGSDLNRAYAELGSWVLDQAPRPGSPYREFKAALYGAVDPPFADLLASVDDLELLVGIQWGGVPVGGIVELAEPRRILPDEATWAEPHEVVYMIEVAGQRIGYPLRVLGRHELSNDFASTAEGEQIPFAASYCSLCRTAVAFDRRLDGRELYFRTSGLLNDANKLMVDNETGSLWQQASGQAVAGPLKGSQLKILPIQMLTFGDFLVAPGNAIVDLPAPFINDPETGTTTTYAYTDAEPLADYVEGGRLWFPVAGVAGEPDPLHQVLTLVVDGVSLAVDSSQLGVEASVVPFGTVLVLVVPDAESTKLYDVSDLVDPVTEAAGLTPELVEELVADDSNSLAGRELQTGFEAWFSWLARHPDTMKWPPPEGIASP